MNYLNRLLTLFLMISIMIVSTACPLASSPPKRTFTVQLHQADHQTESFRWKDVQTGEVFELFTNHPHFSDLILISPEDYKLERQYQDLLINRCKKWR